jgi:chromosome segregation ATPase
MSEQELRSQIADKEDEITRVEEEASKKEASAEKEIEADFDDKINDTKSKLEVGEVDLKEATEKSKEWTKKMNKLNVEVSALKKKHENLVKGKAKALNKKLDNILKNKKSKIKAFEAEIKTLRKKVEKLEYFIHYPY